MNSDNAIEYSKAMKDIRNVCIVLRKLCFSDFVFNERCIIIFSIIEALHCCWEQQHPRSETYSVSQWWRIISKWVEDVCRGVREDHHSSGGGVESRPRKTGRREEQSKVECYLFRSKVWESGPIAGFYVNLREAQVYDQLLPQGKRILLSQWMFVIGWATKVRQRCLFPGLRFQQVDGRYLLPGSVWGSQDDQVDESCICFSIFSILVFFFRFP